MVLGVLAFLELWARNVQRRFVVHGKDGRIDGGVVVGLQDQIQVYERLCNA